MTLRFESLHWTLAESGGHARQRRGHAKKEEQGGKPCSRNCVDPISRLILDLIERATLLVRVRAPPETWTTSLSSDSLSLNW